MTNQTMGSPSGHADLEIRIRGKQERGYPVELRLDNAQEFDGGFLPQDLPPGYNTVESFSAEELSAWFFSDARLRTAWADVRGQHPARRVRLRIDEDSPEIHALPWELLRDADLDQTVAAASATPFSRYLAGRWRPGSPVLSRPLRVLVALANPTGLDRFGLQAIEVAQERQLLEEAVAGLEVELSWLVGDFSLAELQQRLRQGAGAGRRGFHVLHFVGHGSTNRNTGVAALYLGRSAGSGSPAADGKAKPETVPEQDLAAVLGDLLAGRQQQPEEMLRLVLLASCQTATRHSADAFRGLAPALVQAGVPAVLAMQDRVAVSTAREFACRFYQQLLGHGQVDRASNEARSSVVAARLPGSAVPVLFMRLPEGQLLGRRGELSLAGGAETRDFWETLLEKITFSECVPILGPGVLQGLADDPGDIAEALAEKTGYPLANRRDLAQVAQFIKFRSGTSPSDHYLNHLKLDVLRRLDVRLSPLQERKLLSRSTLNEVIAEANWVERVLDRHETTVFHMLAGFDLPLYLTTNADSFLAEALAQRLLLRLGREEDYRLEIDGADVTPLAQLHPGLRSRLLAAAGPQDLAALRKEAGVRQEGLRWDFASSAAKDYRLAARPSPNQPVVFHLNGSGGDERQRSNLVLCEDDYLAHLVRFSRDRDLVLPGDVIEALERHSLLFLGFRIDDWSFRVLLRGLITSIDSYKSVERGRDRDRKWNIGVQLEVEDATDRARALEYLGQYLQVFSINVYWGTPQQFVADLYARFQEVLRDE